MAVILSTITHCWVRDTSAGKLKRDKLLVWKESTWNRDSGSDTVTDIYKCLVQWIGMGDWDYWKWIIRELGSQEVG